MADLKRILIIAAAIAVAGCASPAVPYDEQFVTHVNPVTGKPAAWLIGPSAEQQNEWRRNHGAGK